MEKHTLKMCINYCRLKCFPFLLYSFGRKTMIKNINEIRKFHMILVNIVTIKCLVFCLSTSTWKSFDCSTNNTCNKYSLVQD